MIEKLEKQQVPLPDNPAVVKWVGMDNESLFNKINELVGAVNALVYEHDKDSDWYDGNHIADTSKKVDPYTEQRKWIGCVWLNTEM